MRFLPESAEEKVDSDMPSFSVEDIQNSARWQPVMWEHLHSTRMSNGASEMRKLAWHLLCVAFSPHEEKKMPPNLSSEEAVLCLVGQDEGRVCYSHACEEARDQESRPQK